MPFDLPGILPRRTRRPERKDGSMTAEALKRLRERAGSMQEAATTFEPIYSPWQGVNKLAQAAVGGMLNRKLEHEEAIATEREQRERAAAMRKLTEAMRPTPPPPVPMEPAMAPQGASTAPQEGMGYDWLLQRESGGDFGAMNPQGYAGRAQFGAARLADAQAAGVIPEGTGPQMLVDDPRMQQEIEAWHFGDLERQADQLMASRALPTEIAGVPVTREGLVAAAHLGGAEGMRQFLETGGQYNPADANGTTLLDYLALGAQHAAGGMRESAYPPGMRETASGPDLTGVMAALSDPALDDRTRQVALAMLPQFMPEEPASPVPIGPGHALVDPATGRTIYENPAAPGGPTTNVNVGGPAPYGPLQAGEVLRTDEQGNPVAIEPIPGGKLAREEEEAAAQEKLAREQTARTATVVTNAAQEAAALVDRFGWRSAGPLGGAMSATGLSEVSALIDTVRSNVSLDKIVEMKKTGATLGQVSEKELELLSDSLGKISVWMPPEVLHENLTFIAETYGKIAEDLASAPADTGGAEEAPAEAPAAPEAAPEPAAPAAPADDAGGFPAELEGITLGDRSARDIWEQLTPEAREQLRRDLGAL